MTGAQFGQFILALIGVAIVVALAVAAQLAVPALLQGAGVRAYRAGARRSW